MGRKTQDPDSPRDPRLLKAWRLRHVVGYQTHHLRDNWEKRILRYWRNGIARAYLDSLLRHIRRQRLSQSQIASSLGLEPSVVSKWSRTSSISFESYCTLLTVMGIEPGELRLPSRAELFTRGYIEAIDKTNEIELGIARRPITRLEFDYLQAFFQDWAFPVTSAADPKLTQKLTEAYDLIVRKMKDVPVIPFTSFLLLLDACAVSYLLVEAAVGSIALSWLGQNMWATAQGDPKSW